MNEHIAEDLRGLAVELDGLNYDPANARLHDDRNLGAIESSLRAFGQRKPIVVRKSDMTVMAGNGTLEAAKRLGWTTIAAVMVDEDRMTSARYAIADNRTAELATWDQEVLTALLGTLDTDSMLELGFSNGDLAGLLDEVGAESATNLEKYTAKIILPIYEPTGDRPAVGSLVDNVRANELVAEIVRHDLPDDIAHFLKIAATRHTVFNFQRIAEFYAHADPEVQELMEKSGLVIIDLDKAVEYGFVKMTEAIAETFATLGHDIGGEDA
jgi:hypothetical protein